MLIFPAIDLRAGNAVRLAQGDYARETVYDTDPISVAGAFIDSGASWLHVVDLDGARSGEPHHWPTIERIAKMGAYVQFGGGVRSVETVQRLLRIGVSRVVIGTRLVTEPWFGARLFADFGERVAAGIDVRDGNVASAGWAATSALLAEEVATQATKDGCRRIIVTDIKRDGMQSGPNIELLEAVRRASPGVPVIHSGGIGSLADIQSLVALGPHSPEGVIVGRALYEGAFTLADAIAAASS